MKQRYKIFTGSNVEKEKNNYWSECEEDRVVYITVTKKRFYAYIEWDYKTIDKYLQINGNWDNCTCQDELIKLREDYMQTVDLPRKQQFSSIQKNVGAFYIKYNDIDQILPKICKIFDDVMASNCLNIVPIEEIEFLADILKVLGVGEK